MKKYHKTDIAPVEQENERDETYQASNPQIDKTRTSGNYHIVKRQRSYTQFINDKIEALDLPTKVRKDAVLMCSFVVGSDRKFFGGLSPSEQRQFFAECTRFFAERYGEGNIISAVVHTDETTPHLHLNLIPIAGGRLCAKKLFDRKALTERRLPHCRQTSIGKSAQNGACGAARKEVRQNTLTRRSSRQRRSSSRHADKQATSLPKQITMPNVRLRLHKFTQMAL